MLLLSVWWLCLFSLSLSGCWLTSNFLTFLADTCTANLQAPANKRQHTQQGTLSEINPQAPAGGDAQAAASASGATLQQQASVHHMQQASPKAPEAGMPHAVQDAALAEVVPHPVQTDREVDAPAAAPHHGQTAVPDNNTVMWEPLVVRVSSSCKLKPQ